jgi:adenylosuccinate synthase
LKNRLIIGGQWGDEGKGKIVDSLSEGVNWVIRYQGGANAGHTIVHKGEEVVLHLLPAGILREDVMAYLGNGMVIDPWSLRDEIMGLEEKGMKVRDRLRISTGAHLILPFHKMYDGLVESTLKRKSIGTTGRGIGPAYEEKANRLGLRMGDLLLPQENLERKIIEKVLRANEVLATQYETDPIPAPGIAQELVVLAKNFAPMIVDGYQELEGVRKGTETALFEGAQGVLLDVDHGTYPFVTSSNPTVGGALTGTGLPARCLGDVVGIFKAYCTRVGNGPFPTELLGEDGASLQKLGGEFGATTGRPRRCGWFDLPAARYAVDINGMTGLIVTKLDVLDSLPTISVCTGYELDGQPLSRFTANSDILDRVKPVYREFTGWEKRINECRSLQDLPAATRQYLEFLEQELGVHVIGISVGKRRDEVIWTPEGVTT